MSTTIVRKLYWDFEKEERWLNEMVGRGLCLIDYRWGTYEFERCKPGSWQYRIQLLKEDARAEASREYIGFVSETGVEPVATYMRWVYFRKRASEGPFDLFSDIDSRLEHYKRVRAFHGVLTAVLAMTMTLLVPTTLRIIEEVIGAFWGLPILLIYVVLVIIQFSQTLKAARRVRELSERREMEE